MIQIPAFNFDCRLTVCRYAALPAGRATRRALPEGSVPPLSLGHLGQSVLKQQFNGSQHSIGSYIFCFRPCADFASLPSPAAKLARIVFCRLQVYYGSVFLSFRRQIRLEAQICKKPLRFRLRFRVSLFRVDCSVCRLKRIQ